MPGQPNMNISIFGYTNGSRTQVFNANVDLNNENGEFKINPVVSRYFFDSPIRDIGISFQPRPKPTPTELQQGFFNFKNSAIIVVMLTNSRRFTVIGFVFDVNNGVSVDINAKQTFTIDNGEDRFFQHALARIDCDEETQSSVTSTTQKMECVVVTASANSIVLDLDTFSAEEMNRKKEVVSKFGYGRTIKNVPGYLPLIVVKDRETIIIQSMRDDSKPVSSETQLLNNEWFIAVYKTKVGEYPAEIITAQDLQTDSNPLLIHMFHRMIHEKDGTQHDELFIVTGGNIDSASGAAKPNKFLRRNSLTQ